MSVVYVLLVAHFVGDFVFQSDWMALNKSKRWDALALHVGVYMFVTFGLLCAASNHGVIRLMPFGNAIAWLLTNAAAHFVQDAITSRITSRLWFLRFVLAGKKWRELYSNGDGSGGSAETEAFYIDDLGTRHWFFVAIGFDQLLHYVTLFVTAGWWLQ